MQAQRGAEGGHWTRRPHLFRPAPKAVTISESARNTLRKPSGQRRENRGVGEANGALLPRCTQRLRCSRWPVLWEYATSEKQPASGQMATPGHGVIPTLGSRVPTEPDFHYQN